MSATLDADRLCAYFNGCPLMHIEGLAYPVTDVYLEDILEFTQYTLPEQSVDRNQKRGYKQNKMSRNDMEKDIKYKAEIGEWHCNSLCNECHIIYLSGIFCIDSSTLFKYLVSQIFTSRMSLI